MKINNLLLWMAIPLVFLTCKKDDPEPQPEPPAPQPTRMVNLQFRHIADTSDLAFGATLFNPNGDQYSVSKFMYYISNVVLIKHDNSIHKVPESYFLIDHARASSLLVGLKVPQATYRSVSFMLGVDSARNTSGAQTGALDPANKMFWTWSSGYIFLKLEGNSPQAGSTGKTLTYHVGGFAGVNKTQRTFAYELGNADVAADKDITLGFSTNVNELFRSPNLIDFSTDYNLMSEGSGANKYADNYADMIIYTGPVK